MWMSRKKIINIYQVLTLEKHACMLSFFCHVQVFVTLWTVAHQAPLSMGFSRQEYCNGLPYSPPGFLSNPEIKPKSLTSPALAGRFFTTSTTWESCHAKGMVLNAF